MAERGYYLGHPWHYTGGETEALRRQGGVSHTKLVSEPRRDPDLWILSPFSSSCITGHKRAACGHLYPTDVLVLAHECFNLNDLPAFKNQENPYKRPDFWLLLDPWEISQMRSAFLPGDNWGSQ